MTSNAKYTPAPQVDPDDHADYTQAPPSYQAEASAANDEARLFGGAPRASEDGDVPDDFKVRTRGTRSSTRRRPPRMTLFAASSEDRGN